MLNRYQRQWQDTMPEAWDKLEDRDQLEELRRQSHKLPVVIFKHSPQCGVSAMAKHELENDWHFETGDLQFYLVDVIRNRPVSNEVAHQFGITHHSPQLLLIRDGRVVFHTSHHRISMRGLVRELNGSASE